MKLSGFGNIKINVKPLETNKTEKVIKDVNAISFKKGDKINGFDGKVGSKIDKRAIEMYGRKYEKVSILDRESLYLFVNSKGNVLTFDRDGKKEIVIEAVERNQKINNKKVIQVTLASEADIKENRFIPLKYSTDYNFMIFEDTYEPVKIVGPDETIYYVNEIERDKIDFGSTEFLKIRIADQLNKTYKKILVNGETMEPLLIEGEFVIDIKPLQGYDKGNYEFTLDSVDPNSTDRYNNNKKYIIDISDEIESIKLDEKKENAIFNMEGIPGFNKIENLIKKWILKILLM